MKNITRRIVLSALLAGIAASSASPAALAWGHSHESGHAHSHWHDMRPFREHEVMEWRGGHWHHGWYGGRLGWWWVAGGSWYFFAHPIYPYPDPYVPSTVIIQQAPPAPAQEPAPAAGTTAPPPPPAGTAQPGSWYYCEKSRSYYPYVSSCAGGWKQVPAAPAE